MNGKKREKQIWQTLVREFVADLQRALSCVTDERLSYAGGEYPRETPHVVTFAKGAAVPLDGPLGLTLVVALAYRIIPNAGYLPPWKIETTKYIYGIEDSEGNEVFSYHWHPDGTSRVTGPHLHVGTASGQMTPGKDLYRKVTRAHFPTRRVSLEEVLRCLIEELDSRPTRTDWRSILDQTQTAFEAKLTWR